MNPHERDETWETPTNLRGAALRLVLTQVAVGALLVAVLKVLPHSLGWGLWVPAAAVLVGSWAWAKREARARPELLTLEGVRGLARAIILPLGVACGGAYMMLVAAVPDQLDLPPAMLVVVAALIGAFGGLTGAVLTLCGLDMGRPASNRPPRA